MAETTTGLRVVDLLGVFYRGEDRGLRVADEFEGARDVDAVLGSFSGVRVRLLAHHRPTEPPDPARWGGGCCLLENTGRCHFGHHEDPRRLFSFNGGGVLRTADGEWLLEDDATATTVWLDALLGHRSQIVVMSSPDMGRIEEDVAGLDPGDMQDTTIDDLLARLRRTRDLIEHINDLKSKIDV